MVWSESIGEYGETVTLEEREPGGNLRLRYRDPETGRLVRVSLGHKDRKAGRASRLSTYLALQEGRDPNRTWTLGQILDRYLAVMTPRKKTRRERSQDERRVELFKSAFDGGKSPMEIDVSAWQSFAVARAEGVLDARGAYVSRGDRTTVRPRTVQYDQLWLRRVLDWATRYRAPVTGQRPLTENPLRHPDFDVTEVKNVERPIADDESFRDLLDEARGHTMEERWRGRRQECSSYLPDLLILAHEQGARIGAIVALRAENIILSEGRRGVIHWPAETDKNGRARRQPVSRLSRFVLSQRIQWANRHGTICLFPSPTELTEPVSVRLVSEWARAVADEHEIEWGGWHSLRRKWASDRSHLPTRLVADAGGWNDTRTMEQSYMHAKVERMEDVMDISVAKKLHEELAQGVADEGQR